MKKYVVLFVHNDIKNPTETTCTISKGGSMVATATVKKYVHDKCNKKQAERFAVVKACSSVALDYKETSIVLSIAGF